MALQQNVETAVNLQAAQVQKMESDFKAAANANDKSKAQQLYLSALKLGVDNNLSIQKNPQLGIYVFTPQEKGKTLNGVLRTMQESKPVQMNAPGAKAEYHVNRAQGVLDAIVYRVETRRDKLQVLHDTAFALKDAMKGTITAEGIMKHKDKISDPVLKSLLATMDGKNLTAAQKAGLEKIASAFNKQVEVASNTVTQSQEAQNTVTNEVKQDGIDLGKNVQNWLGNTFKGLQNPLQMIDNPWTALATFGALIYGAKKVGFMKTIGLLAGGEVLTKLATGGKHGLFGSLGEVFGWAEKNVAGAKAATYETTTASTVEAAKKNPAESREVATAAAIGVLPLSLILNPSGGAINVMQNNLDLEFFKAESTLEQVYAKQYPTHMEHIKKHGITHTEIGGQMKSVLEGFYAENQAAIDNFVTNKDAEKANVTKMSKSYKVLRYIKALTDSANRQKIDKHVNDKLAIAKAGANNPKNPKRAEAQKQADELQAARNTIAATLNPAGKPEPALSSFLALFSDTEGKYKQAEAAIKAVL